MVRKLVVLRRERLQGDDDPRLLQGRLHGPEHFDGVLHAGRAVDARQQVALLGGTQDHPASARLGAEPRQRCEILRRAAPHLGVRAGQMITLGLGQSQCRATITSPVRSACRRISARRWAEMSLTELAKVNGASSMPE